VLIAGLISAWPVLACTRSQESTDTEAATATGAVADRPRDADEAADSPRTAEQAADRARADDAKDPWDKPRSDELAEQRREMVRRQIEARGVKDPQVLAAMRDVPRHWFVPDNMRSMAYADRPLPIGEGQTISQPYIVALMTAALELTPESKVLEIGTGSGYQAAVLAELTPHVFTIEIVQPLGERAIATFKKRGYRTIQARVGDGYRGWPEHAPFDAIIVTCAPDHIPPKLVEQLAPAGRICIPVGGERGVQELVVVMKQNDGSLERKTLIPVRFVPMTGEAQTPGADRD
jgi:protein-L-isoaspartate(D-aspartate) O-methyltransferase